MIFNYNLIKNCINHIYNIANNKTIIYMPKDMITELNIISNKDNIKINGLITNPLIMNNYKSNLYIYFRF